MKLTKLLAAVSAIAMLTTVFTACDKDESTSSEETEASVTSEQTTEEKETDTADNTIRFLSDYDLNPKAGNNKSIALQLFEDVYGGKIEWVPTTRNNMYDDLANAILSDAGVDMFPYMDNAVPYGISQDYFQPLDDYINLDDDMWKDMKGLADRMAYNGSHYAVPTEVINPVVLIYDKNAVKNSEIGDPYSLYKSGKWTWDNFIGLMKEFDGTGCTGWIGQGIMQSTGQTYVNYDGSAFSNNIENEALKNSGEIIEQISGPMYDEEWHEYLSDDVLFLGMGQWAVPRSNEENEEGDIFFVPFPSADGKGSSVTADIRSKLLVKGSEKGSAVAQYLQCERVAATEEKYVKAQKDAALKQGYTSEQYDFLQELKNPDNVVFDFAYGMSKSVSNNATDYDVRGAINNMNDALLTGYADAPSAWTEIRDSFKKIIDEEIKKYK